MLRKQYLLTLLSGLFLTVGCSSGDTGTQPTAPERMTINSVDLSFESRGVSVPATIVTPAGSAGTALPLVVMAHGHGGSRQEGGGYQLVAEAMAKRGIASIRMDFPGCGDSTESFVENNLGNMLQDLQAARLFAASEIDVDADRVGLLGYSMGGRLVALLSEIDPSYSAMVTWAPAVADGAERERITTFGGPDEYDANKQRAQQQGSSLYTTEWGTQLEVGPGWFADMENSKPQAALAKFTGPLLVVYGEADATVSPAISVSAVTAAVNSENAMALGIPGAGHGFGFYTDAPEVAELVVESTADFMAENL